MAKFQDEVQLIMSARDEQIDALRKAERNAMQAEQRQSRREKEALDRARKQTKQREQIQQQGYGKAEKNASEAGHRVGNAFEMPLIKAALRATAAFGSMELGLGAANAIALLMSGNIEDAAEGLKKLPVVGGFVRQLDTALGLLTGTTAELARIEAVNNAINRSIDVQRASALAVAKVEKDRLDTLRQINQEIARLRAAPEDRGMLGQQQDIQNRVREAREKLREAQRQGLESGDVEAIREIREERRKLEKQLDRGTVIGPDLRGNVIADFISDPLGEAGILESDKNIRKRIANQVAQLKGAEDQIRRESERRRDAEIAAARELYSKTRELAIEQQKDLTRQQKEQVEERAQAERDAAIAAANERKRIADREFDEAMQRARDLAKEQTRQRSEELKQQREQINDRRSAIKEEIQRMRSITNAPVQQNTADQRRFLTGVSERSSQLDRQTMDPQRQQIKVLEKLASDLGRRLDKLDTIDESLRNGPRVVGANFGSNN